MSALILYFLLAVVVSFLCSLLEAVLLSTTHAHVAILLKEGRRCGHILLKYKEKIDHPLAAILTLNTVAHTVGAAGVGAQANEIFGSQWAALTSGILTICILVFTEIIPKTIGAVYWKSLSPMAAYTIRGLITVTYPFVLAFEIIAKLIAPKSPQAKVTREEVAVAAEMGGAEGQLKERERLVIKNLLRLNNIGAKNVMTPRSVVFALQEDETIGNVVDKHAPMRFSRIPIYGRSMDDITGFVRRYPVNQAYSKGKKDQPVKILASPLHAVPMTKSVAEVLDEFILRREHIFLVVDEYGGTEGIITLEDAIETLLGVEIVDELDSVEDMQQFARDQWEKKKRNQLIEDQ